MAVPAAFLDWDGTSYHVPVGGECGPRVETLTPTVVVNGVIQELLYSVPGCDGVLEGTLTHG
jgi:hypothetical protein